MHISEFQELISKKYEKRDRERGTPRTFLWFIEEVGELATALAGDDHDNKVMIETTNNLSVDLSTEIPSLKDRRNLRNTRYILADLLRTVL